MCRRCEPRERSRRTGRRARRRPRGAASLESPPFEAPGIERLGHRPRLASRRSRGRHRRSSRCVVGERGQGGQVHDGRRDHTVAPMAEVPCGAVPARLGTAPSRPRRGRSVRLSRAAARPAAARGAARQPHAASLARGRVAARRRSSALDVGVGRARGAATRRAADGAPARRGRPGADAALPLRRLAVRCGEPRSRRPAARARAGARSAPRAARGRARARARRPRDHRRLQSGEPLGRAPAARPPAPPPARRAPGELFLPHAGEFIGYRRLRDWLRLLSFEVEAGRFGCYIPPLTSARWLARFDWMERAGDHWWPVFGALYYIVAVKRVRGMRLVGLIRKEARVKAVTAPAPVAVTPARREPSCGAEATRASRIGDEVDSPTPTAPARRPTRARPAGAPC